MMITKYEGFAHPSARPQTRIGSTLVRLSVPLALLVLAFSQPAHASQAYGSINNFDCVNDTGVEAHGFDIELDDIHSKDITYTYDWSHYSVPTITEDNTDPLHPKVRVRYAGKFINGAWTAYTAIPAGPIPPTQGHQFTDPSVNFGGEHFGVGYTVNPTAVRYFWLIDDLTPAHNLAHGPPVNVSTPIFTNVAPPLQPIVIVAVIVPPPPVAPAAFQFGDAQWVKEIKTTSHNPNKVHLNDLVADDPGNPQPWANGENPEVEVEWRMMQTEFGAANGGKNGELAGAPEELPNGDEIVTRRYEFYKYTGPLDAETGEAVGDTVGPDGIHGIGMVTYADYFDFAIGEWHTTTVDMSTIVVVGDFFGAQMSAVDVAPVMGLIDHLQDGEKDAVYPERTVVVAGALPFLASIKSGSLPDGLSLDPVTGVLSGTPTAAGTFTFEVQADELGGASLTQSYTVTISAAGGVIHYDITTCASPLAGGTTTGDGTYNSGDSVTVVATANPGYRFVEWTHDGNHASPLASYTFIASANVNLVANFVQTFDVTTSASPSAGGTTSGDGTFDSGHFVTVVAAANPGYNFLNWTEGGAVVSVSASYGFTLAANRTLVANFERITYTINTSASPSAGGTTSGGGTVNSGDSVTVIATPSFGYNFVNWTEGAAIVSSSASYTFTADNNHNFVANFVKIPTPSDVTAQFKITHTGVRFNKTTGRYAVTLALTNKGNAVTGPISLVLDALPAGVSLFNKTGMTVLMLPAGSPYLNVFSGTMAAKASITVNLEFDAARKSDVSFTERVLAGPGTR